MKFVKFLLIFAFSGPVCFSSDLELKIQEAATLDASGQSQKAKDLLLTTLQTGEESENSILLFNLGILSTKTNQVGEAFVYFSNALWLDPLFSEARIARTDVQKKLTPMAASTKPKTWFNWWPDQVRFLSWQPWLLCALLVLALWLGSRPNLRAMESWQWGALALFFLTSGAALTLVMEQRLPVAGILKTTKVLSGPDSSFPEISSIDSGALVNIEEKKSNWLKIRFQNNTKKEAVGWIESPTALAFTRL